MGTISSSELKNLTARYRFEVVVCEDGQVGQAAVRAVVEVDNPASLDFNPVAGHFVEVTALEVFKRVRFTATAPSVEEAARRLEQAVGLVLMHYAALMSKVRSLEATAAKMPHRVEYLFDPATGAYLENLPAEA